MFFSKKNLELENARKKSLEKFCARVGIKFHDLSLLNLAFKHRSFSNENVANKTEKILNNERLEFLGDSVLGMVTAAFLYNDMQENQEGELSRIKSLVVSELSLAPIALKLGLDELLILGHGEELNGGRQKKAILADCVEAVIGAYYLDSGYKAAQKFVLSFIEDEIRKIQQNKGLHDYKTILQEFLQKKFKKCPHYELVKKTGPDHDRTFYIAVRFEDQKFKAGIGKSKKEAEQNAAKNAIETLCPQKI